jgi:hypothetical protein
LIHMSGHRSPPRTLAACALLLVSLPASAAAQVAPYPWPYTPPAPTAPYSPYSRPAPYSQPSQPGYQQLPNNAEEDVTSRRARSWPILRASGGAALTFAPEGDALPSFILDVTAGYRWAFHHRATLAIEAGYSHDTEPSTGGNFGTLGAGPELFLSRYIGFGWMPKLVIGETWRGFGIGVRNTLVVPLLYRIFTVELGHQYLRVDGRLDQHELRAQLGVDFAAAGYFLVRRAVRRGR